MIDFMQRGGPLMWLLLFCSILAGAIFLERTLYFHRVGMSPGDFLRGLAELIRHQRWAEAQMECAGNPTPLTRVLHAAVLRHGAARAELKAAKVRYADLCDAGGSTHIPVSVITAGLPGEDI